MLTSDLASKVAVTADISKLKARKILDIVVANIQQSLLQGEPVKFKGLGTWKIIFSKGYTKRCPYVSGEVHVAPRKLLKFKVSKVFKDLLHKCN